MNLLRQRVVVDTGPLVAFVNRRDNQHQAATELFLRASPPVFCCAAVLTEVCFLVRSVPSGPTKVLELCLRGVLQLPYNEGADLPALATLIAKYHTVPMSFADACLIRMLELGHGEVLATFDSDFLVYRLGGKAEVPLVGFDV